MEGLIRRKLNILPLEKRLMLDASLPAIAGQVLWLDGADDTTILDADGDDAATGTGGNNDGFAGTVATWRDKSGNNNHVEQTNSTYRPSLGTSNSLTALEFAGNGDFLEDSDAETYLAGLSELTIFMVVDSDTASTDSGIFITDNPDGSDDVLSIRYDVAGFSGGGSEVLKAGLAAGSGNTSTETSNNSASANTQLISMSWQSGGAIDIFINSIDDVPTAPSGILSGVTDNISTLLLGKGAKDQSVNSSWDGLINEFIIYDRDLSSAERQQIETYLAGKWSIALDGNIPPTLDTNTGASVDEGNTVTITNSELAASDPEGALPSDWFDADWQYRNQITIDAANIDSDLTDFTMLIDGSGLGMDFWSNVQNDGGDIVITSADGTTQLARELVSIDTVAQTMELHTQIPNVSSTVDTDLFIYYGNTAANETNDAATTFSNYSHVYHMDNLNAVDVIAANNGAHSSGGSITTGIMGGAHLYTGTGLVDITDINGVNVRTVSFWYNPADRGGGNFGSILGSNGFNDGIRHTGTDELNIRSGGSIVASTSNTFNTDKHLVFSYDDALGIVNIYENGMLQDSNAFSGWHDLSYLIGIAGNTARAPDGMVDEIRISTSILSEEWAAAEYANQSDPSTFYSVGTQENNTSDSVLYTLTSDVTNGTLFLDSNGNNVVDGGEVLSVNDTFRQDDIDNNLLKYTHDDSSTTSDSFDFAISDGIATLNGQSFAITINPSVTFSDIDNIPNAVLHFDATDLDADGSTADQPADGSAVSQWNDRAGQITNATTGGSARPVYDDNAFGYATGGIVFDGIDDRLFFNTSGEVNSSTYTEKAFAFTFRTGSDVVSDQLIYEQGGGTHGFNFGIFDGNIYAHQYRSGASISYAVDLGAATANTTYSVIAIFDSGANTWQANINGGAFTTIPTSGNMPGHGGGPGFGTENGNTRSPVDGSSITNLDFGGAIGEFWSWNRALTSTEIGDVDDYLQDKWFDTPHSIGTNAALNVAENATVVIGNTNLQTNDAEAPDTALTYTLTGLPSQGILYRSGVALGFSDTFTQDDINNGLVTFDHDGTAAPTSDSFDFSVSDGFSPDIAGTFNFNITAAPATDPILTANNAITLNEGAGATISNADLRTEDGNTADNALIYEVTSLVNNGTLFNDGVALNLNDTFTQDDINNSRITYTHDDSEVFADNFSFTVTDGTTTLGPSIFYININPVNDQAPTDIALSSTNVNENSGNGTVIGTLSATDADLPGDSLTYSVVSDPDNKFQIIGNQLRVNGTLNHETAASHNVTIRVSDGTFTYDEGYNISVNDVNEAPTDITLSQNIIAENATIGTVIGTLGASDPDLPGDSLTFTVFADPDNKFQIVGNELRVNGTLDIEAQASHNVTIRVADGNGGTYNESFTINITDLNDIPVVTVGEANTSQGQTLTLTTSMLSATDQDNPDAGLIYEITALPTDGTLALNGTALMLSDTFTQQDIIDGNLTYAHDNAATVTSDSFSFTVTDGALTTAPDTVTIILDVYQSVNSAPTVDEGGDIAVTNTDLTYEVNWFDNAWAYRQAITVDSAQIDSDLTNFPLLITENGLDANFWSNVETDGTDIVVTDSEGNRLDRELVAIDTIGQTIQLYVRTDLSSVTDTELYLYYGNNAAAETNAATTWRSEYTGVWHFDDDFNDGDAADSSQSAHDGFARNGFDNTNSVVGLTGNAAQFNNTEYLALNYSYSGNNVLPQISVSAWINTTVNSGGQADNWSLIDFDRSELFNVFIHGDGTVGFSTAGSGLSIHDQTTSATVNDGTWHHIAAVYDGTDKILYIDGVEADRVVNVYGGAALGQNTRFAFIGDGSEAGSFDGGRNDGYYDGLFDNVRIFEGTKNAAWIAAEYRNSQNPATFYSVGTETDRTLLTTYTVQSLPTNGTLYFDTNLNGTLDSGEELGVTDTFTQNDINNAFLRYTHNGGETTTDSFTFTVRDNASNTTALQSFSFIINPVNDVPTDILLGGDNITENSNSGTTIGTLTTTDVDLPGDSFTYTIVDDPDNKFAISGDRLVVAGSLDFENTQTHTVTIRTDDNNGGTFDRTFTINVTNLADDTVILQSNDRPMQIGNAIQTGRPGLNIGLTKLEELEAFSDQAAIVSASLAGDAAFLTALYGMGSGWQIVRETTTLDLAQARQAQLVAISPVNVADVQTPEPSPIDPQTPTPDPVSEQDRYTNLRQALAFLQQMDTQQNDDMTTEDEQPDRLPYNALEQKFQDVLTYHQQRQNALREALMREG